MYKSNPHLVVHEEAAALSQLKSPSIVNLISRSTRDLTRAGNDHHDRYSNINNNYDAVDNKKSVFLKNLHDRSPELYKALEDGGGDQRYQNGNLFKYREREASLGSRSPVTINKDTATIMRRGSSSTEDYSESFKTSTKSTDPDRPGVTNTIESFSRKTVPSPDGRSATRIESREVKSVSSSHRYGTPTLNGGSRLRNGSNGGNGVVIELVKNHQRY